MACDNAPADDHSRQEGVCHICAIRDRLPAILKPFVGMGGRSKQEVAFCRSCCHWFCGPCKKKLGGRFIGFVKEHTSGKFEGCCGPDVV